MFTPELLLSIVAGVISVTVTTVYLVSYRISSSRKLQVSLETARLRESLQREWELTEGEAPPPRPAPWADQRSSLIERSTHVEVDTRSLVERDASRALAAKPLRAITEDPQKKDLSVVIEQLGGASDKVKIYEPTWANYLSDAVAFWQQFVSSKAYSSVFATDRKGTALNVFLNGYVHRHLNDIHRSVVEKEYTNLAECLGNLDLAVSNLAEFAANWHDFLGIAASGISKHVSPQKYDERRHAITIFKSPQGEEFDWVPWEAMHREPHRLDELALWLVSVFADIHWEFDLVCALSNTADPLGTLLMVKSRKPLVAIDNDEHTFLPPSPAIFRDRRVLLIDTLVRTGETYGKAKDALMQAGATVTGGFFLVHNDMIGEKSFKPKMERNVICLYQISEIYTEWLMQLGRVPVAI